MSGNLFATESKNGTNKISNSNLPRGTLLQCSYHSPRGRGDAGRLLTIAGQWKSYDWIKKLMALALVFNLAVARLRSL